VSRTVPLDPVIGRPLSLSGAFDLYVSAPELVRIIPMLDLLASSGILTLHNRSIEDGGLIANVSAPVVDVSNTSGIIAPAPLQAQPFTIPDGAATYVYTTPKTIEFVDAIVHKIGAGTGTTYQIQDGAGVAITDAISATTDKQKVGMGTIDRTKNKISAGATFKIVVAKSSGTSTAELIAYVILR
jgi:hypothetical protein